MAVGEAHVFLGFVTLILTQFSFQSHRLLFSHASAEVRVENTLEYAPTGYPTHNHQVMSPYKVMSECPSPRVARHIILSTVEPVLFFHFWKVQLTLSQTTILDSSKLKEVADDNFKFIKNSRKFSKWVENNVGKGEIAHNEQYLLFPQCFQKTCTPDSKNKGLLISTFTENNTQPFNCCVLITHVII